MTKRPGRRIGDEARFEDVLADQLSRPELNPHLTGHREFGRPLVPAAEAQGFKGHWEDAFGRKAPFYLEIGSGNGEFMVEVGRRNPGWNLLGIEIRYKRTWLCAKKIRAAKITNVLIARYHAAFLADFLLPGELAGIFVNHPDPWPKERHEKNRLISRWFLEDVALYLAPGGFLRLKSDFAPNCDRVEGLLDDALPLRITGRSADIARDGAPWPDDIMTNYQGKMLKSGIPVHAIELVRG